MSNTQPKAAIRTTSRPLATEYDVMFDREVDAPNEHQEELYVMRQAGEGDLVNMRINTDGGRISTATAVHGIITKSKAQFHAILESDASSVGSMLFLMADTQEVYPLATMYIHTCQSGMGGHSQEMKAYGQFIGDLAEKLVREVYKDFLSEEEMVKVLDGGVIWLQAEEIEERLKLREAAREKVTVEVLRETHTLDVCALQAVEDFREDCDYMRYDLVELLTRTLELAKEAEAKEEEVVAAEPEVEETSRISLEQITCFGGTGVEKLSLIRNSQNRTTLRAIAKDLGISFAHNIGIEKLRQKILDIVEH